MREKVAPFLKPVTGGRALSGAAASNAYLAAERRLNILALIAPRWRLVEWPRLYRHSGDEVPKMVRFRNPERSGLLGREHRKSGHGPFAGPQG
jgi:hypothetical protein